MIDSGVEKMATFVSGETVDEEVFFPALYNGAALHDLDPLPELGQEEPGLGD